MSISEDLKRKILNRVTEGVPYVEVGREFGVSIGSIHNFVEEEKKNVPDYDELRRLNIMLKKNNLTVDGARRGNECAAILNGYGLGLDDLDDYLSLTEGLLSENGLEADFIGYAVRFRRLSIENEMSYEDFIDDCERKQQSARNAQVSEMQARAGFDETIAETGKAKLALLEVAAKVRRYTSLHSGLKKIGVDKLVRVVQFVPEFEALGYDVEEVKQFADLKRKLEDLGVDPDKLESDLLETSYLVHRNQLLGVSIEEGKRESRELTQSNIALSNRNNRLAAIDQVMKTSLVPMACKSCGVQLNIALENDEFYRRMIANNSLFQWTCPVCGCHQRFTAWDIVFQVASLVIPRTIDIPLP